LFLGAVRLLKLARLLDRLGVGGVPFGADLTGAALIAAMVRPEPEADQQSQYETGARQDRHVENREHWLSFRGPPVGVASLRTAFSPIPLIRRLMFTPRFPRPPPWRHPCPSPQCRTRQPRGSQPPRCRTR